MGKVMGLAAATETELPKEKLFLQWLKSYWFKIKYILIAEFG
jgi:hypothetical protein